MVNTDGRASFFSLKNGYNTKIINFIIHNAYKMSWHVNKCDNNNMREGLIINLTNCFYGYLLCVLSVSLHTFQSPLTILLTAYQLPQIVLLYRMEKIYMYRHLLHGPSVPSVSQIEKWKCITYNTLFIKNKLHFCF